MSESNVGGMDHKSANKQLMKNILFLCFLSFSTVIQAQDDDYPYPSLSPEGSITQVVGNTKIELTYERPAVRNRKIFGELVPWKKVWRTGAGKCTRISFDKPVKLQGQPVAAGAFSLFTIPTPDEWVVIINADTTLYGSYDYDKKKDVVRFSVPSEKTKRFYESLTFDIDFVPNNAKMYMSWANTQIAFDITTTTDEEIKNFIKTELLTGRKKVSNSYAGAASYLDFQGEDYPMALKLADNALELDSETTWAYNTKISIYVKLRMYDEALTTITQGIEATKKRSFESEKARMTSIEDYRTRYRYIETLKEEE